MRGTRPGAEHFMRFVSKICGAADSLVWLSVSTGVPSGCDAAGGQKTEYKPIETNILKKLGRRARDRATRPRRNTHPPEGKKKR